MEMDRPDERLSRDKGTTAPIAGKALTRQHNPLEEALANVYAFHGPSLISRVRAGYRLPGCTRRLLYPFAWRIRGFCLAAEWNRRFYPFVSSESRASGRLVPLHSDYDRLNRCRLQRGQESAIDQDRDAARHPLSLIHI